MTPQPNKLIPRELPENVKPTINLFGDTLDEIVNFGTQLLLWDNNPKTYGEENIPPTMLFRHFLDLLDSISILVRKSCGDTSKLLIRGALEVTFGLEYLFEKDTHNRSMAFLVIDILDQIKTLKKYSKQTNEGQQFYKILNDEKLLTDISFEENLDLNKAIVDKESILKLPQFHKAHKEYEKLKRNGEKGIKWYRFFNGPKNIYGLAKHLKKSTFYELLYHKWSGATHGSDIYLGKLTHNKQGGLDIVQLRYIKDVQEITKYSIVLSMMVLRLFLNNRVPHRSKELSEWYLTIKDNCTLIVRKNLITVE